MNPISPDTIARRRKLRVATKLMSWIAVLGIVYVFISGLRSGDGEVASVPSMKVAVADMQPGESRFLDWEGRPVLVYRREDADITRLRTPDERLVDPLSRKSSQPEWAENDFRSASSNWFVAIALGTDLGCSLEFLPAEQMPFQEQPWQGGFIDTCRKARYDLAGRVYEAQYATRNLTVPQYSITDKELVLGR